MENVAIVMHFNLRLPNATPVLAPLNYDASAKFEVAQPVCCHLIASECNQAICSGVIAIHIFDLMTLNLCHMLLLALK